MMEKEHSNQETSSPGALPSVSTSQLAIAAIILSALTGAVFFTEISFSKTSAVAAAGEVTSEHSLDPFLNMKLEAKSAVAVDLPSGKVLYELNPDVQLPLASIAKIALVASVADVLNPEEYIVLVNNAYSIGSADRLEVGERWLVKDIIDYTLLGSSNGGATALAAAADAPLRALYPDAKDGEAALFAMNALADQLELGHTYFLNTSGLDEDGAVSGAYGSARDVVKLLARAYAFSKLFSSTAQEKLVVWEAGGTKAAVAFNTNEALPVIPGLILGKTGFTDLAGGNLAIVFEPEPAHPVAVVILGSTKEGRFSDMEEFVHRIREAL